MWTWVMVGSGLAGAGTSEHRPVMGLHGSAHAISVSTSKARR